MKKEKLLLPLRNSGVSFEYRGSKTAGNGTFSVIMGIVLSYVLILAASLGAIFTFTTMFAVPFYELPFFIFATVYAFAMVVVFSLPKKAVRYTMLGILAALIIMALIFLNEVIAGAEYVKDFVLVGIAKSMFWEDPLLSYSFSEAMKVDTSVIIFGLAVLVITGVSYFTIRKVNFLLVFLITFPLFEIGAAFGCVPNHFCFAAMLSAWMGIFAMHAAVVVKKIKKRRGDKKKTKTTAAKRKQSLIATIGVVVAVITFICFSFANFMVSVAGYDRPENIKQLRTDFKDSIADFIDYVFGLDNDGSLREGQLYQMDDRVIKNRRYLTIKAPARSGATYLRGYVGGTYTGDSFQPTVTEEIYNWLEQSYKSSGYYPQNMQGKLLDAYKDENKIVKNSYAEVTISNLRRKKDYAFLTYIPLIPGNFNLSGDAVVEPANKSEYTYNAYMDDTNKFLLKFSSLYDDSEFSSIWQEYSKYVKNTYLKYPTNIPEIVDIVEGLKNGTGYGYKGKGVTMTNMEIADRIREYLKANTKYSLEVDKLPEEKDFVKWFVTEGKTGYSAHYAASMAVMLRMANVPTRYVEGYVILPEDLKEAHKDVNGYYTYDVTDYSAHAWVEIYDVNYGWIPIEATPGFYTGSLMDGINASQMEQIGGTQSEQEEEFTHNPDSDKIVFEETEEVELPEEEKIETEQSSALETILSVIKYFFVVVGILVAVAIAVTVITLIFLIIRRFIVLASLNSAIKQGAVNKRVNTIYRYYTRLLRFEKIENKENMPYMQFARLATKSSKALNGDEHIKSMEIFLKHRFSNTEITKTELECLKNTAITYRKKSLKMLKGSEKFKFMFIENLG